MSWIFLFIVLLICAAIFVFVFSKIFGRGEELQPLDNGVVRADNQQAVEEGNVDDIRFEVVLRGYRQDQVDAVIDQLVAENKRLRGIEVEPTATVDEPKEEEEKGAHAL
ncbi:MAG: DivIVA domain-containing protein [Corynebacterium sp.]|nr:DivIVA domain-containing protein [Corynebacterium sp.]